MSVSAIASGRASTRAIEWLIIVEPAMMETHPSAAAILPAPRAATTVVARAPATTSKVARQKSAPSMSANPRSVVPISIAALAPAMHVWVIASSAAAQRSQDLPILCCRATAN